MKYICEYGRYVNGIPQEPEGSVCTESLWEAVKEVAQNYGFETIDWQAIPSRIAINSELLDTDTNKVDVNLNGMIEIKSSHANELAKTVYLKLPFEMSDSEISKQLPT